MSKHPIPDWLRSQFSRIEDEVQKLGPCGVFTQMRTVTQSYFEHQAEAAQPPALDDDLERGMDLGMFLAEMKSVKAERDQLKARCNELEHRAADVVEGADGEQLPGAMTMRIRKLKAALSKPAGSKQP
ncbi:hypothetical protein [Pseudomonas syringae]|uniref:hypothetical protein n=1 Tax=Pseudomonas syringae TaxID=317 RepID=UPI000EFE409E|nr:hypothetical protein [Pseudomonas syringae]